MSGCAAVPVELSPAHPYAEDFHGSYSWHQLRFKWRWPQGRGPAWHLDVLVADQVLAGVIKRHRQALPLWRFHRRAGRTPAGHQFSFIFYSSDTVAEGIERAAADHVVTGRLLAQGLLERKPYLTRPQRASALGATSDPRWPKKLQAAWPMFIMGASQTWLGLVESQARTNGADAREIDMARQLERYSTINDQVTKIWSRYAQHAFFHHLSGLFGYEPVRIRKRIHF